MDYEKELRDVTRVAFTLGRILSYVSQIVTIKCPVEWRDDMDFASNWLQSKEPKPAEESKAIEELNKEEIIQ